MTKGTLITMINEPNPLGLWLKTSILELGLRQCDLAERVGVRQNAISQVLNRKGPGPSFGTAMAGELVAAVIEAERSAWKDIWHKDPWGNRKRYPANRPALLRHAAFTLSHWNRQGRSGREDRAREFREMLPIISDDIYRQMMQMAWAPFYGAIARKGAVPRHMEIVASAREYSDRIPAYRGASHRAREAFGEILISAEASLSPKEAARILEQVQTMPADKTLEEILNDMDPRERHLDSEERVFDTEVLFHAAQGDPVAALERVAQRWEAKVEALQETGHEAWIEQRQQDAAGELRASGAPLR